MQKTIKTTHNLHLFFSWTLWKILDMCACAMGHAAHASPITTMNQTRRSLISLLYILFTLHGHGHGPTQSSSFNIQLVRTRTSKIAISRLRWLTPSIVIEPSPAASVPIHASSRP